MLKWNYFYANKADNLLLDFAHRSHIFIKPSKELAYLKGEKLIIINRDNLLLDFAHRSHIYL